MINDIAITFSRCQEEAHDFQLSHFAAYKVEAAAVLRGAMAGGRIQKKAAVGSSGKEKVPPTSQAYLPLSKMGRCSMERCDNCKRAALHTFERFTQESQGTDSRMALLSLWQILVFSVPRKINYFKGPATNLLSLLGLGISFNFEWDYHSFKDASITCTTTTTGFH